MHVKIPQTTHHGHKDKHPEKVCWFLQKRILHSLKKSIHSSKNIFREKLYYQYIEYDSSLWCIKIVISQPVWSKKYQESQNSTREHLRTKCYRKSTCNLLFILLMNMSWEKIIKTLRHAKIIISPKNNHKTHNRVESSELFNRNRIRYNNFDYIACWGNQKRKEVNPDIFSE